MSPVSLTSLLLVLHPTKPPRLTSATSRRTVSQNIRSVSISANADKYVTIQASLPATPKPRRSWPVLQALSLTARSRPADWTSLTGRRPSARPADTLTASTLEMLDTKLLIFDRDFTWTSYMQRSLNDTTPTLDCA